MNKLIVLAAIVLLAALVFWLNRRRLQSSTDDVQSTIRHIPKNKRVPSGFVRVPDLFSLHGKSEDGIVKPGTPISIDVLRPGESIKIPFTIRPRGDE